MELREAPPGPRGSLLLQGGYTAKSSTYANYRAVASWALTPGEFVGDVAIGGDAATGWAGEPDHSALS